VGLGQQADCLLGSEPINLVRFVSHRNDRYLAQRAKEEELNQLLAPPLNPKAVEPQPEKGRQLRSDSSSNIISNLPYLTDGKATRLPIPHDQSYSGMRALGAASTLLRTI